MVNTTGNFTYGAALATASDEELLDEARAGTLDAFWILWLRSEKHTKAWLAKRVTHPADRDDIFSMARDRILTALQNGNGPRDCLMPYALCALKTAVSDHFGGRETPTDFLELYSNSTDDEILEQMATVDEQLFVREVFGVLPKDDQDALYMADVEGMSHRHISEQIGQTVVTTRKRVSRARQGLRNTYLRKSMAVLPEPTDECRDMRYRMIEVVQGRASDACIESLDAHREECDPCDRAFASINGLGAHRGLLLPIFGLGDRLRSWGRWVPKPRAAMAVGMTAVVGVAAASGATQASVLPMFQSSSEPVVATAEETPASELTDIPAPLTPPVPESSELENPPGGPPPAVDDNSPPGPPHSKPPAHSKDKVPGGGGTLPVDPPPADPTPVPDDDTTKEPVDEDAPLEEDEQPADEGSEDPVDEPIDETPPSDTPPGDTPPDSAPPTNPDDEQPDEGESPEVTPPDDKPPNESDNGDNRCHNNPNCDADGDLTVPNESPGRP